MATESATPLTPSTSLDAELAQLRQENELLRAQRQQLLEQRKQSTRTIEQLQHQLQHLLRRLYGRSAEKIDPQQMLLFERLLDQLAPRTLVEEFAKIKSGDVLLRTETTDGRPGKRVRVRCVTTPDNAQKVLLNRLGLRPPPAATLPRRD